MKRDSLLLLALVVSSARCAPVEPRTPSVLVVRGRVVDSSTQRSLPSAVVTLPDLKIGRLADTAGEFMFRIPRPTSTELKVLGRYIGYERTETRVFLTSDSVYVMIRMPQAPIQLDDLIVTSPSKR